MCNRKTIYLIIVTVILCVVGAGLPFLVEGIEWSIWRDAATEVKIGDDRVTALEKMGVPTIKFAAGKMLANQFLAEFILGNDAAVDAIPDHQINPETWIYGKRLTLRYAYYGFEPPFFYPFRYRIGPYPDDVVIEIDSEGKVSRVRIPRGPFASRDE